MWLKLTAIPRQCNKCGRLKDEWNIVLVFDELDSEPVICMPCLAEALGLGTHKTKQEIQESINTITADA